MLDFAIFYLIVGYIVNNTIALIGLYGADEDEDVEVDGMGFLLTIPVWPYTLFRFIQAYTQGDE